MSLTMNFGRATALVVSFFFPGAVVVSQSPPPPPPPLVRGTGNYTPEKLNGLYESKDGGFKIAFPAKPGIQNRDTESSFGKSTMTVYFLPTSLAVYTLVHLDFPTAIKDKFDLDVRFDAMRDNQLERTGGRLISENELYFGSHYGRDIVLEDTKTTHWLRVLMVEQRLFVIGVQTRGNIATQSAALKTSNESRAKKFFDSFVVTQIPKPAMTPVELPDDFGVSINGAAVTSDFLGISFEAPKDWVTLDTDEKDFVLELGKDEVARKQPKLAERMKSDSSRVVYAASRHPLGTTVNTGLLLVGVEKAPYPNFLALSAAKSAVFVEPDKSQQVTQPPAVRHIGGIEFAWIETLDSNKKLKQRMYFANVKGLMLTIVLTYTDDADRDVMLRSLESIRTKK
jgi:hypothetical protein